MPPHISLRVNRRAALISAAALPTAAATSHPLLAWAQTLPNTGATPPAAAAERRFTPTPGRWRTFDLTTRVQLPAGVGASRVWLPLPGIESGYQHTVDHQWTGNASTTRQVADAHSGASMLLAEFTGNEIAPQITLTSRVRTQDRALDWAARAPRAATALDAAERQHWLRATDLMPTTGIVRQTALQATRGARTDVDKVRALYDWVVTHTYREPAVKGCGTGDIAAMLETGNLGGKCGDINALFVGLCRAAGVPARDVYGIRLVPSAFGYKELSGNPANLSRAQHCRAEVHLAGHGWVAMDPADVGKVMRLETPEWLKTPQHPVVAPVHRALFGGWEGNWLGFNTAHDVALPGSKGPRLGFFMYPQAETAAGCLDALEPDRFQYQISAREVTA